MCVIVHDGIEHCYQMRTACLFSIFAVSFRALFHAFYLQDDQEKSDTIPMPKSDEKKKKAAQLKKKKKRKRTKKAEDEDKPEQQEETSVDEDSRGTCPCTCVARALHVYQQYWYS